MRSVGSTAAVFFWESFITELAQRAQIDQYAYRRNLLSDPLALRVLDAAAQASGWGSSTDKYRGIAFNCYIGRGGRFKTYVAEVAELRRIAERFVVERIFCAVDAGLVVNPNTLKAQIEGGIGFAMTNTLKSKITFSNGGTDQSNFYDYPLLSIDEMPEIVPIVLASDRPPQGAGEVFWHRSLPPSHRPCCTPPAGGSTSCHFLLVFSGLRSKAVRNRKIGNGIVTT
jgi:isoquinoline 1-oxidoreductase beta subunit